jgi:hypothetical protein
MAVNGRQISSDWRTVDYTGNYTSEKAGQTFVLRVGGAGNVVLRNIITDTQITIEALDGERIEMLTDTVYSTSTATNIQAIYE